MSTVSKSSVKSEDGEGHQGEEEEDTEEIQVEPEKPTGESEVRQWAVCTLCIQAIRLCSTVVLYIFECRFNI